MQPELVKIYSTTETARLKYILGIIFDSILGVPYEITSDKRRLGRNPVINYSKENIPGSFLITPNNLLFEDGIKEQELWIGWWKELPVLYQSSPESDMPIDIFASSFYLISRYEEYLPFTPDEHGRYYAELSVAYKNNFLHLPVIDLWVREFAALLVKKFPRLTFKRNNFSALMTIDVDQPFAFRGRSIFRSLLIFFKDHPALESSFREKIRCILGRETDPYDTFDYIDDQLTRNNSRHFFFFPVGKRGPFDKNPSPVNPYYRKLIRRRLCNRNVGIHPSYNSTSEPDLIGEEKMILEQILRKEVSASRQHYIRLTFPKTYRSLLQNGITSDYSMGFVRECGFRAGIAQPFLWFDLQSNETTALKVVPFQIMDGTLNLYKYYDVERAREEIRKMIKRTREVGGCFVSVWHNTSLIERGPWRGWRELFEYTLNEQKRDD